MNKIPLLLLFFIGASAMAQKITVSAKVIDKETKEPLIFASVGILDKPIGTISNMQGDFDFYLPLEYRNNILIISTLGYNNYKAPVW
ncbi:MAG: carboxypeptidase-like regulatory domain-containing protein, partial [Bacteroidia bacterium]|nr:carboxypeptidase-like regulatory domain-containing protein [Bacteroidia bacterium]